MVDAVASGRLPTETRLREKRKLRSTQLVTPMSRTRSGLSRWGQTVHPDRGPDNYMQLIWVA
jgi:hypothetical protein